MPKAAKKHKSKRHRGNSWQLQDAKNGLSEVVRRAETDGPQFITRHNESKAVVLSQAEYQSLTKRAGPKKSLYEFLRDSPLRELLEEDPTVFDRVRDNPEKHRDVKFGD